MTKFLVFALFLTVALAAEVDWSQVRVKNYIPDSLKTLNPQIPASFPFTHGRITGGKEAPKHAFPHQVGLILDGTFFCGGSLISNEWVLTAAHCMDDATSAIVFLGAHNIFNTSEERVEIEVDDFNFIIHEGWNSSLAVNDIALINLPETIQFTDKIKPILLPRQVDISNSFEGEPAIASGWGKASDAATSISPVLRYIKTHVYFLYICKLVYGSFATDNNICISGLLGKSTCNGDSGGPLTVNEAAGTPIHVGITSFGSALGCEVNFPAVFTRTTSYLQWIYLNTGIAQR